MFKLPLNYLLESFLFFQIIVLDISLWNIIWEFMFMNRQYWCFLNAQIKLFLS